MTRKTLILAGLFLIALGPISIALQTFFLLSEITSRETHVYFDLFRYLAIPLVFGLLIWKRLKHIGKSRRFTACYFAGILTAYFMSMILVPLMALYFGSNSVDAMTNEIVTWSKSGQKGDFNFSTSAKINMATYNAIILALASWPLFVALYFGAGGPRSPKGNNPLAPLSKHAVEKDNSAFSLRKQMVS